MTHGMSETQSSTPTSSGACTVKHVRVLHVYTEHRAKGGAERFAEANMQLSRRKGLEVGLFTRSSDQLPTNFLGRLQAGLGAIYAPGSLREFGAELDSFQPDLVHLYDYFPLISPWIAPLCAERGIPVVMHCVHYRLTCPVATHFSRGELCTRCTGGREYWAVIKNCRQNIPESITVALHNALVRNLQPLTKHINRFIAPSEFTREWLIENTGVPAERITTVMPFVDMPLAAADPTGEYIAFAGRFTEEKGIQTLLDAARLTGLPFRFCRHHDQPAGVKLPSGVDEVITQNRQELDAFYRGARMLVFPSLWFETFGLVGAEAMSHGIPVITAHIGALTNLVDDEVNGLLFEPGNAVDLSEKITRLWNDQELGRRLGRGARHKALANWTVERYFSQLIQLYDEVTAAAQHAPLPDHVPVDRNSDI
jgi:glycosyltransferase involved in cell wall biosynthesis